MSFVSSDKNLATVDINKNLTLEVFVNLNLDNTLIEVPSIITKFLITQYEIVFEIYDLNLTYKISKRYTEFAGLYDSLKVRYHHLNFPEFPSKSQVFNKIDTRKNFFNQFLKTYLNLAKTHTESKITLLKLLYKFLITNNTSGEKGIVIDSSFDQNFQSRKNNIKEVLNSKNSSNESNNLTNNFFKKSSSNNSFASTDSKDSNINNSSQSIETDSHINKGWYVDYDLAIEGIKQDFYNLTKSKGFCTLKNKNLFIYDSIISNNYAIVMPLWRARFEFLTVVNSTIKIESQAEIEYISQILKNNNNLLNKKLSEVLNDYKLYVRINHPDDKSDLILSLDYNKTEVKSLIEFLDEVYNNQSLSLEEEDICNWKNIETIDETNYYSYGKLYLQLNDIIFNVPEDISIFVKISLTPYNYRTKSIISNNWFVFKQKYLIPIHNKFEILKLEVFTENSSGFIHKKLSEDKITEIRIKLPDLFNKEFVNKTKEDIVFYDKETGIKYTLNSKEEGKITADIPFNLLKLDDKIKKSIQNRILNPDLNDINNLETLKKINNENLINKPKDNILNNKSIEETNNMKNALTANFMNNFTSNADFSVNLSSALNKTVSNETSKNSINISSQDTKHSCSKNNIDKYLENSNLNPISNTLGFMTINLKLQNLTHFMSMTEKNKNKFVLEEQYLRNDEDFSIKLLLKRLKKIISHFKCLTEDYKDLFRWGYPYFSFCCMIVIVIGTLFSDFNYMSSYILLIFLFTLIINSDVFVKVIKPKLEPYYSYENALKFNNMEILNLEDLETSQCLSSNYIINEDKNETSILKQLISPLKYYREYKEKYNEILFNFSKFIAVVEKIKNLLLWKDPVLSFNLTIVLSIMVLISVNLDIRYILAFGMFKKFVVGRSFYVRKYENNEEIAKTIISGLIKDWILLSKDNYKYIKKHVKNSESVDLMINFVLDSLSTKSKETKYFYRSSENNNYSYSNKKKSEFNNKLSIDDQQKDIKKQKNMDKSDSVIDKGSDAYKEKDILDIFALELKQITNDNEKFKSYIKQYYEHHLKAVINNDFLTNMNKITELLDYTIKSKSLLKIQKRSYLYNFMLKNNKIYKPTVEMEDIFYYFIQNVKSELYYSKYYARFNDEEA